MSAPGYRAADPPPPRGPSPHRSRGRLAAGVAAALAVVGVGGGFIGYALASPSAPAASPRSSGGSSSANSTSTAAAGSGGACSITSVANEVLPSVVTVQAAGSSGGASTGSGELINSDGDILTNNHVVSGAANGGQVQVQFSDGAAEPATIVGRDVLTDLAVLRVASTRGVHPIKLGSSASVQVGEPVIAIGSPLGLAGTVTSGIVSALDRTIEVPAENDGTALLVSAVQTDAAINPGNSGGALVNCSGQLIGVPSAGATVPSASGESSGGNIGLGFAIPVDVAKRISQEIIATGRATHSFFGVETVPLPQEAAAEAHVSEGLLVRAVVPGGPAARAGLRAGDVITRIDGQPATSNIQLQQLTLTKDPGDKVPVDYVRGGAQHTATLTLVAQP